MYGECLSPDQVQLNTMHSQDFQTNFVQSKGCWPAVVLMLVLWDLSLRSSTKSIFASKDVSINQVFFYRFMIPSAALMTAKVPPLRGTTQLTCLIMRTYFPLTCLHILLIIWMMISWIIIKVFILHSQSNKFKKYFLQTSKKYKGDYSRASDSKHLPAVILNAYLVNILRFCLIS